MSNYDQLLEKIFLENNEKFERGGYYPLGYENPCVNYLFGDRLFSPSGRTINRCSNYAKYEYIHIILDNKLDFHESNRFTGAVEILVGELRDDLSYFRKCFFKSFPNLTPHEFIVRLIKYESLPAGTVVNSAALHYDFSFMTSQIYDSIKPHEPPSMFFGEPAQFYNPAIYSAEPHSGYAMEGVNRYAIVLFANPILDTYLPGLDKASKGLNKTLGNYLTYTLSLAQGEHKLFKYKGM